MSYKFNFNVWLVVVFTVVVAANKAHATDSTMQDCADTRIGALYIDQGGSWQKVEKNKIYSTSSSGDIKCSMELLSKKILDKSKSATMTGTATYGALLLRSTETHRMEQSSCSGPSLVDGWNFYNCEKTKAFYHLGLYEIEKVVFTPHFEDGSNCTVSAPDGFSVFRGA